MTQQETIPPQTSTESPKSPLELPAPSWKEGIRHAVQQFKADRGTLISAGMAFYWFLAVFPAILAAVGFLGLVRAGPELVGDITRVIRSALPGDAAKVLTDALGRATAESRGSSVVAALVGTALALFSASAGMVALQVGLDVVYNVEEERTFLKKRLRAFLLIVVAAVLGGIATLFIVFGQPLGEALRDHLPFGSAFVLLWTLIRWALGIAALSILFASFYYLGPNRESPRWTWVSPGGIVATLIWLLASLAFSFYVSSLGSYARTYGSFTGVVVLLLWLYLSGLAVVIGGEINAQLERQGERQREKRGPFRRRERGGGQATAGSAPQASRRPEPARRSEPSRPGDAAPAQDGVGTDYEAAWFESMKRLREKSQTPDRP